jgi:hypothetical protein
MPANLDLSSPTGRGRVNDTTHHQSSELLSLRPYATGRSKAYANLAIDCWATFIRSLRVLALLEHSATMCILKRHQLAERGGSHLEAAFAGCAQDFRTCGHRGRSRDDGGSATRSRGAATVLDPASRYA